MFLRNIFPLITLLILTGWSLTAQQNIRGTIADEQSTAPLPGVTVLVIGSDPLIGTSTDMDGNFVLTGVPIGRVDLTFSFIGYESRTMPGVLVNSGKETVLNIRLTEKVQSLNEVVVKADNGSPGEAMNDMATVSARQLSVEEARRYSGTRSDPSRMAQNFAGVSSPGDDRNDIIVRGNSPSGVLWRMEGIDIPNPSHFGTLGATGGPVTILNTNNLSDADFFTGAFPAEYGNATAGVFDLGLRNGNTSKHEFLGQIGFNGFEAGAEGPMGKDSKASYVANYRYSTLGVLSGLGLEFGTGAAIPQYQDLTFKLNMPTKNAGRFSLFGFGGLSYIEFLSSAKEVNAEAVFGEDGLDQIFRSNTGMIGLNHTYFFDQNTYGRFFLAVSGFNSTGDIDSISTEDFTTLVDQTDFDYSQIRYTAGYEFNKKFNARNKLNAGITGDLFDLNLDQRTLVSGTQLPVTAYDGTAGMIRAFGQWQHRFSDALTLNGGVHGTYFLLNETGIIEPRASMRYRFGKNQSINFGAGLHSQLQPLEVYFIETRLPDGSTVQTNRDLDLSKSVHAVVGYDKLIGERLRLKVEGYYQYLYDAGVEQRSSSFSLLNAGADFGFPDNDSLVNEGTGRNMGLELTVERYLNKGWYLLNTISVYDARYTASDNIERNTAFNGNYIANVLGGKEFQLGRGHSVGFDTKVTVGGGRRYTPIDLDASRIADREIRLDDLAFSEQYGTYFRLDLKLSYILEGKRATQKFSVDLQNLTGQQNVFSQSYNRLTQDLDTRYQLGFFPDIQYRILF